MPQSTLFISDLHLCDTRPAITRLFLDFLAREAPDGDALYILGDLFEYWIGDEACEQAQHRPIVAGLRALTSAGTPVFVMHGNRDFLMGRGFERATGCVLLPDPTRIDLYGTPTLLMHGDTLCTDDAEYMEFRNVVRQEAWQREFLAKSLEQRAAISRNYRELSKMSTAQKKPEIMDVTESAVRAVMRQNRVRHLIHGHTHRPATHVFDLDGAEARRVVLGDWYDHGSLLRCDAKAWTEEQLPLAQPPRSSSSVVR